MQGEQLTMESNRGGYAQSAFWPRSRPQLSSFSAYWAVSCRMCIVESARPDLNYPLPLSRTSRYARTPAFRGMEREGREWCLAPRKCDFVAVNELWPRLSLWWGHLRSARIPGRGSKNKKLGGKKICNRFLCLAAQKIRRFWSSIVTWMMYLSEFCEIRVCELIVLFLSFTSWFTNCRDGIPRGFCRTGKLWFYWPPPVRRDWVLYIPEKIAPILLRLYWFWQLIEM